MGVIKGDGEVAWIDVTATPLPLPGYGVAIAYNDITDRKQAEADLRESEARFRQMFEGNIPVKLIIDPADGRIVQANPAACQFYGYDLPTLTAMKISDINILSPAEVQQEMNRAKTQERLYFNFRHRLASGETRTVEVYSSPMQTGDKTLLYSIIHDVTARVKAEATLRESEHKFRNVIEQASDGIIMADETGRLIEWNPAAENIYGLNRAEVLGQMIWDVQFGLLPAERQTPAVYERIKTLLQSYLQTGTPPEINKINESKIQRPDGRLAVVQTSGFFIETDRGFLLGSITRDITQRKQMEDALRESEERLREVLENSLDASYKRNLHTGAYDYLSPVFARLSGYTPEEMVHLPMETVLSLMHPADLAEVDRVIAASMSGAPGISYHVDYRFRHKDGLYRWFHDQFIVAHNAQSRPLALIGSVSDITERKRMEESLRESEQKHRRLFETMAQGVIYYNAEGQIISANPAAERILGLSLDQLDGKTFLNAAWKVVREDGSELPGHEHPVTVAMRTGRQVEHFTLGIFNPQLNTKLWLSITTIPLFQPGEETPFQIYSTFEDITERIQAEAALRESKDFGYKLSGKRNCQIQKLT